MTTLLCDPYLQLPTADGVRVAWATEFEGDGHAVLVGEGVGGLSDAEARDAASGSVVPGVRVFTATTTRLSRVFEDHASRIPEDRRPAVEDGMVPRAVWRHEAAVDGLAPGTRHPYRVISMDAATAALSGTFTLASAPRPGDPLRVLLTSDHQGMPNTPANLQKAGETLGRVDAVFLAGDLADQADRASSWFDDEIGSAFFPALQGRARRADSQGLVDYRGGEIIQHAPLFPAIGNHDVGGRIEGMTSVPASMVAAVPRAIAEAAFDGTGARAEWIEAHSFSTATYEELFTVPADSPGGERYYAVTFGDIRLVSLFATRVWRRSTADPDPADRVETSRYQEAAATLHDPLAQGYGEHIFEPLSVGSAQGEWLRAELASDAFCAARFRVVMLHEGPHGLGNNILPPFADPVRIEERDAAGAVVGVRYEYPRADDILLRDLVPLLEASGVDLVHSGHSHLWNRFRSENGVNYLETSNTGNTHGAAHELSGRSRRVPPEPWDASNYLAQGDPGGLTPILPSVWPFTSPDGIPEPFVQSNDLVVFTVLDTGVGEVVSYAFDVRTPHVSPWIFDRFPLGRS
ncbi:hypothetical protein AAIB33_10960 [Microbacterium sp. AZCO]|uniref:hypothetical protein n=1 Tax=Microbacterium sp. AZCO TaxID=3142976 RepID=UPI0031F43806